MFNPDGGEFERSGNGLRILGSYLALERPGLHTLRVRVGGDEVGVVLHGCQDGVHDIAVEMGRATVGAAAVALDERALDDAGRLPWGATSLDVVPVSVGNPHMVVLTAPGATPAQATLESMGPFLATHPGLAAGANVQLATVTGNRRCAALIWERGVGPTSASGTSACAVAVALVSRGLLESGGITVQMPGGDLLVSVGPQLDVVLRGPVQEVCYGSLTNAMIAGLAGGP
jgi:diaminopimelate epimerase